jgi:Cu/Ag efflux pump CusA
MKLSGTLVAAQGLPLFATLLCAHNKRSFEKLICQVHVSQLPQDRLLEVRETETLVVSILRRIYSPIVEFAVPHRILALAATGLLFALALFAVQLLGLEFLPHLEEGNLWIRATMPPLLAAGSAAYEFHLAAKRSYFHVIADRWCARGGTAREAGRHNRPLVYAVDRCRRSAFVGKGLARSQAKLPRGGRTT